MAKQGQHRNDAHDYAKSKGPNKPSKSVPIITGNYKKHETYEQLAREHKNPEPLPQFAKNEWNEDTRDKPSIENSPRARDSDITGGRSGSDSNASKKTRGH